MVNIQSHDISENTDAELMVITPLPNLDSKYETNRQSSPDRPIHLNCKSLHYSLFLADDSNFDIVQVNVFDTEKIPSKLIYK